MPERRVRLGDILDDYCPRERRITNHAVVAMVDNEVKQTRCVTCEAEHPYRGAQVPTRRRKAASQEALFREVLAGRDKTEPRLLGASGVREEAAPAPSPVRLENPAAEAPEASLGPGAPEAPPVVEEEEKDEGPVHRPLIRATLPRPEGQASPRPIPQFTIRQLPHKKAGPFRDAKRMLWPTDNGRAVGPAARVTGPFGRGSADRLSGPRGRPAPRPERPEKKRPR